MPDNIIITSDGSSAWSLGTPDSRPTGRLSFNRNGDLHLKLAACVAMIKPNLQYAYTFSTGTSATPTDSSHHYFRIEEIAFRVVDQKLYVKFLGLPECSTFGVDEEKASTNLEQLPYLLSVIIQRIADSTILELKDALEHLWHRETGFCLPKSTQIMGTLGFMLFPVLREIGVDQVAVDSMIAGPSKGADYRNTLQHTFKEIVYSITGSKAPTLLRALWPTLHKGNTKHMVQIAPEVAAIPGVIDRQAYQLQQDGAQNVTWSSSSTAGSVTITCHYPDPVTFQGILIAGILLKRLPLEHVIQIIKAVNTHEVVWYGLNHSGADLALGRLTKLLKYFQPVTIVTIFTTWPRPDSILDIADMLEQYGEPSSIPEPLRADFPKGLRPPSRWKTGKELHDKVSENYTKIKKCAENIALQNCSPALQALDGMEGGFDPSETSELPPATFKLVLPKDTETIVEWGQKLHNCIASYADRMVAGKTLLVGVEKDGVLSYTMELAHPAELSGMSLAQIERSLNIKQLVQDHNKPVEPEYREFIATMVDDWFVNVVVPPLDPHGDLFGVRRETKSDGTIS